MSNFLRILIGGVVAIIAVVFLFFQVVQINDNGYRTVVQWPNGHTFVRFTPGLFVSFFGKTTRYPDVLTYDIGGETSEKDVAAGNVHGISVRYQDGGLGTVDGIVRVDLPDSADLMVELHRAFRDAEGLNTKLIEPEVRQALNLTAGLMTSEEAYAERRNDFANYGNDQIQYGRFKTRLQEREIVGIDGSKQKKRVPVPMQAEDGSLLHQESPFTVYGMRVSGFQITDWSFESKTLDQISTKRESEMAAITFDAAARRALAEKSQITAQGQAEVERIRYQELQVAEKAKIGAERDKQVAVIRAEQQKEVNAQQLEAAKIDVETADAQKNAEILRAQGNAEARRMIIQADDALAQKLAAYIEVNGVWAEAYSKRQVPGFVMGGGAGGGTETDAATFQAMVNALVAKQIAFEPMPSK